MRGSLRFVVASESGGIAVPKLKGELVPMPRIHSRSQNEK